jgi:hypothetical protein
VVERAAAQVKAKEWEAAGYHLAHAQHLETHPSAIAQTLFYAASVIGLTPPPAFEADDPGGLGFIQTTPPAVLLGQGAINTDMPPQATAFLAGHHLAYYRPGLSLRQRLSSGTGLKAWLFAALRLNAPGFAVPADLEGPVVENQMLLEDVLSAHEKEHLVSVVSKLLKAEAALDLKRWQRGVDLTADRVGFLLCHDLETAVEVIRSSDPSTSSVAAPARLRELVLFAISETYFGLRQKLGIGLDAPA